MSKESHETEISSIDAPQTVRKIGARPREDGIELLVVYVGAEIRVFLTDCQAGTLIECIQAARAESLLALGAPN